MWDKRVFYMWLCPSSLVFHVASPQTCLFVVQARPCSYDLCGLLPSCAVRNLSPLQLGSRPDHLKNDSDLCGDLIRNRLVCSGWERNLFLSKRARRVCRQSWVTHGFSCSPDACQASRVSARADVTVTWDCSHRAAECSAVVRSGEGFRYWVLDSESSANPFMYRFGRPANECNSPLPWMLRAPAGSCPVSEISLWEFVAGKISLKGAARAV